MILVRYLLICIIGYLIIRAFVKFGEEDKSSGGKNVKINKDKSHQKKVSKSIGEYVDYEETKKK
jgi:hypothetical protein